ncbi:MAG TPA: sugar kinase [Puia sp.]|nr:sugar kinase [Puia sp.]
MRKKVLSFGELLLRICPDAEGDWLADNSLPFYVGGAEANVATALALWGIPSAYLTALPDNLLTRQLAAWLEERGIDTSRLLYRGERLGLYYLPKGKDLKQGGVIYDRAHSSFSALRPGMIDWDQVLEEIGWLHFSAISPALGQHVTDVCAEGLKAAREKGITISVDLNYRAKLWQYGIPPSAVMPGLIAHCNVVMGNLWAAEKMLGIPVDPQLAVSGRKEDFLEHARRSSVAIVDRFPQVRLVAKTFRFDRGDRGIHYYATLFANDGFYSSREYASDAIVDKVGSGDCFMAGLIRGLYRQQPPQATLEFAAAAAFYKLFIPGDATDQPAEDIEKFIVTHERQ